MPPSSLSGPVPLPARLLPLLTKELFLLPPREHLDDPGGAAPEAKGGSGCLPNWLDDLSGTEAVSFHPALSPKGSQYDRPANAV